MLLDYLQEGRKEHELASGRILGRPEREAYDLEHVIDGLVGSFSTLDEGQHVDSRLGFPAELPFDDH